MCHQLSMYSCVKEEIRITIFNVLGIAQTKDSIKNVSNIYGVVMESENNYYKLKPSQLNNYMSLGYCVRIFIRLKRLRQINIIIISYNLILILIVISLCCSTG